MVEPMAAHSDPTPEAIEGVPSGDWQETMLAHQTILTSMTRHSFPSKVLTIDYLSAIWARWLLRWYLRLEYLEPIDHAGSVEEVLTGQRRCFLRHQALLAYWTVLDLKVGGITIGRSDRRRGLERRHPNWGSGGSGGSSGVPTHVVRKVRGVGALHLGPGHSDGGTRAVC